MTMAELSAEYRATARQLSDILRPLRRQLRECTDSEERFSLKQRISVLTQILTQTRELAQLTEHYYERGFWHNEKYTL